MNLILVTSVLRPICIGSESIFTTAERISQTIRTVKTIKTKVKRCYIVMIEGGRIENEEKELFKGLVDELFVVDGSSYCKSKGEAHLLYKYLTSSNFTSLCNDDLPVNTVTKISGRYYLNDIFTDSSVFILYSPYSMLALKFVILFVKETHLGKSAYNTTFYKIHKSDLDYFVKGLDIYLNIGEDSLDIEHCFFKYNVIPFENVYSPEIIGISGFISRDGTPVDM
jgi:hypothetical protein